MTQKTGNKCMSVYLCIKEDLEHWQIKKNIVIRFFKKKI